MAQDNDNSDLVEAGTKTTVDVSASAYDARHGIDSDDVGCGESGCLPALTRDGVSDDDESRWSCAKEIVPDGGQCEIEFTFGTPQDLLGVQVAFWKGDERTRTLKVKASRRGMFASTNTCFMRHESYGRSTPITATCSSHRARTTHARVAICHCAIGLAAPAWNGWLRCANKKVLSPFLSGARQPKVGSENGGTPRPTAQWWARDMVIVCLC